MKKISILFLTVFLILFLVYWGYSRQSLAVESDTGNKRFATDSDDVKAAVGGNTAFAFSLYGKLKGDSNTPKRNLFFSPYSISNALAMTYGGARGETQKQMDKALHFTLPSQNLYSIFGALQKQLVQENKSHGYQLFLANALWGQKGEPFLKEFLDLTQYWGAGFNQVDFVNETESSRKKINSWVEEKTKDNIKDLIPAGGVDELTRLVLTNAIYFKGEWKNKFSKWMTRKKEDFAVSVNHKVKTPMMHLEEDFNYYVDEKLQILEMPYKGDEMSMVVVLPNETDGIKEVEKKLTVDSLNDLLSKISKVKVDVSFPKFKMTWGTFSMNKVLIDLGMKDAFIQGKADFSGMNDKRDLYISHVYHKAFVEVDEEGTEGAAATEVAMSLSIQAEPTVFRADHPFIFIIKDNRSGSILFMGRLMNPAE